MGVDLRLVPLMVDHEGAGALCEYVTLELDRSRDLWARLGDSLEVHPFDRELWHLHDEGGTRTREDAYGTPLTWAKAGDLAFVLAQWVAEQEQGAMSASPWTKAAAVYLRALDSETRVVLWWH